MTKLNPYLTFNGNCKEAMNFYKEVLGGDLSILLVGDSPVADQMPPGFHEGVLHSTLKAGDLEIMATDMTPNKLVEGNMVHLCLACKDEEETRTMFDKLSDGGNVNQPLNEMFFGWIGTLTDKFGKPWMLECDKK